MYSVKHAPSFALLGMLTLSSCIEELSIIVRLLQGLLTQMWNAHEFSIVQVQCPRGQPVLQGP